MPTANLLRDRRDVDPDDIDDIIEIAVELQEQQRAESDKATVGEIQDVAAELDIDPALVESAIEELKRRREDEAQRLEQESDEAAARRAQLVQFGTIAFAAVLVLAIAMIGWAGMAASQLGSHADAVAAAEADLLTVLDRRAALTPQLLALSGGDIASVQRELDAYRDADDLDAKVSTADALGTAMGVALGKLPPPTDEASRRQREELRYELTGIQNRISTEQQRYRQAAAAWDAAADGPSAALALRLGLASPPD